MKNSLVTLRRWTLKDAPFALKVRNNPVLMQWFKQDESITFEQQRSFIEYDLFYNKYLGCIIEVNKKPIGLCNIAESGEFGIAILPEYQHKGYATKAMRLMLKGRNNIWGECFAKNPALSWYLHKCGFVVTGVRERAYYKKNAGLIDIIRIEQMREPNVSRTPEGNQM